MPLDHRLREGIDRVTSHVDPDLDYNLERTMRRARRTIAVRRAGAAIIVVAAIAVGIAIAPRALDALRNERLPGPAGTPTISNPAFVAGTYETVVPGDEPAAQQDGLAGRWTIAFGTDGRMTVTAPSSFTGVLSGSLFQIQGDRFRTNLFVQDVCSNLPTNAYRWIQSGNELRFSTIDDPCEGRVAVFTSALWTRVG